MSFLARSSVLATRRAAQVSRQQVRFAHEEINRVGHTLPTSVKSKPWLAMKIMAFAALGFGTPFYAVHFHLKKAGGA